MNHVNAVTSYFNFNTKANMLIRQKQLENGVTRDRVKKLKHDVPTSWNSSLGDILSYITNEKKISCVVSELDIDPEQVPALSTGELDELEELIHVAREVQRVASQL